MQLSFVESKGNLYSIRRFETPSSQALLLIEAPMLDSKARLSGHRPRPSDPGCKLLILVSLEAHWYDSSIARQKLPCVCRDFGNQERMSATQRSMLHEHQVPDVRTHDLHKSKAPRETVQSFCI
jgi:hypothetical protein